MAKKMKKVKPLRDPTKITAVVFRKWKEKAWYGMDDGIIALFPEIPADYAGKFCQCYEHIGQHSYANYNHVISNTDRAGVKACSELKDELESIGYKLKVFQKRTPEIIRNFSKAVDSLNT